MGPAFQQVYSLLPTLLHYHHPLMPGYLDGNVPKGICLYTPDETQRHYLNELELYRGMSVQDPPKGELPITVASYRALRKEKKAMKLPRSSLVWCVLIVCLTLLIFTYLTRKSLCEIRYRDGYREVAAFMAYESGK